MTQEKQETRAEEVARVHQYLASQAMRRTPEQLIEALREVQQQFVAAARIPDELVLKTNLIGTDEMVRERLRIYQRAGVNTLQVNPDGQTLDERLSTLARLGELVRAINDEA